jgi:hypothetical protein
MRINQIEMSEMPAGATITTIQISLDCGHGLNVPITVPKTAGDGLDGKSFCPTCNCEQDIVDVSPAKVDVYVQLSLFDL